VQDKENPKKWYMYGKYNLVGKTVHVTELPPSVTYEAYEKKLDKTN